MYRHTKVQLEAIKPEHMEAILQLYNDYRGLAGIESNNQVILPTVMTEINDIQEGGSRFVIRRLLKTTGGYEPAEVVGYCSIGWNQVTRVADPMILLHKDYRKQGYGREVLELLLYIMFGEMNAMKCTATVFSFNDASIGLVTSLGFQQEGRMRQEVYRNGRYHDMLYFGKLIWEHYEKDDAILEDARRFTGVLL